MTTSTSLQVHVQPERVELRLGEPVSLEVQVFNGSLIVDEFAVELVGPIFDPLQTEWIVAVPPVLPLFPDASGTVTLTLLAPAGSNLAAGAHRVAVRVSSTTQKQQAVVAEITLAVASQPALFMRLEPETVTGGRTAELQVQVRNVGNSPLHLAFGADDPANALTFSFGARELELPLDSEQFVPLEVAGRRPIIGRTAQRAFAVAATITDRATELDVEPIVFGEPAHATGMFHQRPWLSSGVLSAFAILLPVLAILIAAFIIRPPVEAPLLTGELTFGVDGTVTDVFARERRTLLTGAPMAKLSEEVVKLELDGRQVALREAVVGREALELQQLSSQVSGVIAGESSKEFLAALQDMLTAAQEHALVVSGSAVTGLSQAFAAYCALLEDPLPDCANPNLPLTDEVVAVLQQDTSSLAAGVVLDANEKYRSIVVTQQDLQALLDLVEGQAAPDAAPPTAEEQAALAAAVAQQAALDAEQAKTDRAKADLAVAEAAHACTEAIRAVGLTMLRAPFDIHVTAALITRGAEVKADDPAFKVERTDGRAFVLSGQRLPAAADIPPNESCPTDLPGWQKVDAAADGVTPPTAPK